MIEQNGFPTSAKRVEKSGFRTGHLITRLSRIRLTTILKADYITFWGASFWMGIKNTRQSQTPDRYQILEATMFWMLHFFGGCKTCRSWETSLLPLSWAQIRGIPIIWVWIERINGSQGRNYVINEAKWTNPGFLLWCSGCCDGFFLIAV